MQGFLSKVEFILFVVLVAIPLSILTILWIWADGRRLGFW